MNYDWDTGFPNSQLTSLGIVLQLHLRLLPPFANVLPTPEDEKNDEPSKDRHRSYSQRSDDCGLKRLILAAPG